VRPIAFQYLADPRCLASRLRGPADSQYVRCVTMRCGSEKRYWSATFVRLAAFCCNWVTIND
jgi:hypothetical protein